MRLRNPLHRGFGSAGTVGHRTKSPSSPSISNNGQVLATEEGGGEEPLGLPDGLLVDEELSGEPLLIVSGTGDGGLITSKPTWGEECQAQRAMRDPGEPSQQEIDEHEAGWHATCRTWREACVENRGVG